MLNEVSQIELKIGDVSDGNFALQIGAVWRSGNGRATGAGDDPAGVRHLRRADAAGGAV